MSNGNGHRWLKFWPQDHSNDLRGCSLAARGLWVELLRLAHEAQPRGSVLINGRAPSAKKLADTLGSTTEREVTKLLAELEAEGVFSRDQDGTIYSRRMRNDEKLSETGRAWGKTGGNPALNGKEHPQEKHAGGLTPPLNHTPYPGPLSQPLTGGVNLYSTEAETDSESEKERKKEEVYINTYLLPKGRESAREATTPKATTEGKGETPDHENTPAFITPELLQMHLNRLTQKLKPPHTPTHARSPTQQIAILNAPAHVSDEQPPPFNEMQSEVVVAPRQPLRPLNPIRSPAQQIAEILSISEDSAAAFLAAKAAQPHTPLQAAA